MSAARNGYWRGKDILAGLPRCVWASRSVCASSSKDVSWSSARKGKNPHPQRDQILVHRLHKFACRGLSLRLYGRQRRQGTAARGRRGPERRSLLENSLDADPVDMSRHDTFRHYEALRQQTATYEVGFLGIASVIRSVKGSHSVANVPSRNSRSRAGQPVPISVTRGASRYLQSGLLGFPTRASSLCSHHDHHRICPSLSLP